MKQIELNLQKRLLIWGYPDNYEVKQDIDILYFRNKDTGATIDIPSQYEFICKGSELTEEIAKGLIEYDGIFELYQYYHDTVPILGDTALNLFKTAIKNYGYYWVENPLQSTRPTNDLTFYDSKEERSICIEKWQEAESKTFNPEKTLIFEIL